MVNPHRRRMSKRASGSRQVHEKVAAQKTIYNSLYQYDSTANEDMFMIDSTKCASKRFLGEPMKKLIAEEMVNDVELKRKAPSVIARLMGLDGLPSPQQLSRHQRKLSESSRQRKDQIDSQRTVHIFVDQASRRNSEKHHDVNDVHEDLEASHIVNRRYSSRWNAYSGPNMNMTEMEIIQNKYLEATHLSTDEMLLSSKGFDDALEGQESNDELLIKCFQQRHSLPSKHLLNLQIDTSSPVCTHIAVLKPAASVHTERTVIHGKQEIDGPWHQDINLQKKREGANFSHLQRPRVDHSSFKSPSIHVKGKDENISPTTIVVLKANCGKTQSDVTSFQYPSEGQELARQLNVGVGKAGLVEMKNSSKYAGFSSSNAKEARKIAKKITTRMRNNLGPLNVRKDFSLIYSDLIGYATDESSCDIYENDFGDEQYPFKSPLGNLYNRDNQCKSTSSGRVESSVQREAKKRLSERWIMTQRCQDMEMVSKGNTLGEMLSLTDKETELGHLDTKVTVDVASDRLPGRSRHGLEYPLGISSRDGWKDGCISSSSRSLSPLRSQIQGMTTPHGIVANSKNLRPRVPVNDIGSVDHNRIKSWDGSQNQTGELLFNDIRPRRKKHRSRHRKASGVNDALQEAICCKMMNTSVQCNLSEQLLASDVPVSKNASSSVDSTKYTDHAEHESITSESSIDLIKKPFTESSESLVLGQDASDLQETSVQLTPPLQCPVPEPESSESSRDSGHPSPVSVLEEVPFTEDSLSGSECLEIVSAKINDLRMKIQQLKMAPDSHADVAADNVVTHPAKVAVEEKCISMSPSWESSYIGDVLMSSGFKESDPEAFISTCHSPDCPLSPSVFENLEKNYSNEDPSLSRNHRRLLFDRINLALLEILKQFVDPCPWVKKPKWVSNSGYQKQDIANALHRCLTEQDSEANRDTSERILEREMRWLDVSDDINIIGREIERSLVDDLILEILMM